MENNYILKWLEEKYPNRTPTTKMTEWELGIRAGERLLIEQLKIKLKIEETDTHDVIK